MQQSPYRVMEKMIVGALVSVSINLMSLIRRLKSKLDSHECSNIHQSRAISLKEAFIFDEWREIGGQKVSP